jgi:hypothetical protein
VGSAFFLLCLCRALLMRPAAIRKSHYPAYIRHSYNLAHIVCLSAGILWALAAWVSLEPADVDLSLGLLASPLLVGFVCMAYARRWQARNADAIPAAFASMRERMFGLKAMKDSGQISEHEFLSRAKLMMQESAKEHKNPSR